MLFASVLEVDSNSPARGRSVTDLLVPLVAVVICGISAEVVITLEFGDTLGETVPIDGGTLDISAPAPPVDRVV